MSLNELVENTLSSKRDVTEVIYAMELNEQDDERFWQGWFNESCEGLHFLNYPYTTTDPKKIETNNYLTRIKVSTIEKLYQKTDLRRKEYWYRLGDTIHIPVYDEELEKNTFEVFQPTFAYINKWREPVYSVNPGINAGTPEGRFLILMDGNSIYWRLADLILLRAECRAHLGRTDAVNDLNRIRERAGLLKYNGSTEKEVLLKEIFDERDRELFGETCRYYDIVRNGYYRDLLKGNYKTLTDEDVKNGALYLPVGSGAFNKNTLMKQNTYWSWYLK